MEMEKQSSAVTLSDMEIFMFPELMYSLLLANIMSPRLWKWREDEWFDGLDKMAPRKRITRLRQYIMDHYVFNLDLDTWGLTTKEQESERFKDYIDPETLARSNALFGYEGDKYYFDIDIRTHFGLDKYEGSIIPYWKTETIEAMDAFRHKPNYLTGAGECVSLAALYAAALFVVAKIPLKDLYLMATPLHSQNFVDLGDGILTNNRRLVTKNMWFNGTAISAQARRALENEQVTVVAHETGVIHAIYDRATIDPEAYEHFTGKIRHYLNIDLTSEVLCNFVRHEQSIQKCFQMKWPLHGTDKYIPMERVLAYEHGSPYSLTDNSREKLMADIDSEEFTTCPLKSRIVLNDLELFVKEEKIDINSPDDVARLKHKFSSDCLNAEIALESLLRFCRIEPRLPNAADKTFVSGQKPLGITDEMTREEIIAQLEAVRGGNDVADLAFYAYRDLSRTGPDAFLKAAVERNPVSVEGTSGVSIDRAAEMISELSNESIYEEDGRLAQPDEVWNYSRGDGAEKAILLANIFIARNPGKKVQIAIAPDNATVKTGDAEYSFASSKGLTEALWEI